MTILVSYEGVLMNHKDQPIMDGFLLVQSLAEKNRIVLATSGSRARVEHQLRTERMADQVAEVIDKTVHLDPLPLWERQIELARSYWTVGMIITADPLISEYAIEHGIVSLFFAHPGFSKPAQRPVQGNRTWEQLTEELDRRWQGV
jgi:hypothetical protein